MNWFLRWTLWPMGLLLQYQPLPMINCKFDYETFCYEPFNTEFNHNIFTLWPSYIFSDLFNTISIMGHLLWTLQRSWSWRRTTWALGIPWSVRSVGRRMWRLPSCPAVTWSAVWTVPPPWGNVPPVERSLRAL